MVQDSKIEWTDDTFNPVIGCAKVAAGCQHCYAERMSARIVARKWGNEAAGGVRVRTSESYWNDPIRWNRKAQKSGIRRRVFCASWADVFEDFSGPIVWRDGRPVINRWSGALYTMNDVRADLFRLIDRTPWLDWLLLTKRPENIPRMWATWPAGSSPDGSDGHGSGARHLKNVWLGTSIAVQADADANIRALQKCRELSPVLFLSCEPLLGPVDLKLGSVGIDWVIAGGESGPRSRPMHPAWPRSLRDQCRSHGVPFFFKQWGEWAIKTHGTSRDQPVRFGSEMFYMSPVGKAVAGRMLDGVTHDEMPRFSLEVRQ